MDQKQKVNTNLCFIIYNKHFKCSNICSACASQLARFLHKMALHEGIVFMTWFCRCSPIWLAISVILKITTYVLNFFFENWQNNTTFTKVQIDYLFSRFCQQNKHFVELFRQVKDSHVLQSEKQPQIPDDHWRMFWGAPIGRPSAPTPGCCMITWVAIAETIQ